jgi:haloalkane dehalogenase
MKQIIFLFLTMLLVSSCSRRNYLPSEKMWDYNKFRSTQKTFKSTDGDIKYVDRGQGAVILLLHGVPSSSWLYRRMIDGLVDGGHRVIAPDMLGFGSSDSPEGYEIYSGENHATRLLALMDHLKIDSWSHVMHDAGGLWTWEMLKQNPKKVDKLIIFNSVIYQEGFHPPVRMKPGTFAKIAIWGYNNGFTTGTLINKLMKMGLNEDNLTKNDIEGYKRPLLENKTKAMYYFFTQTCNALPEYSAVLKNLNMPAMVVWGKNDEMLQWAPQSEQVKKDLNIKENDIHLIDATHFIQEEKPDEINELILKFISRQE